MSKYIVKDISITLFLFVLIFCRANSQALVSKPVRIMFYNVENLFDIKDDPLTDDEDFLPDGSMKWTLNRYNKKINSIYKTIIAAGKGEPPSIVGLCEVENRKVLEDLIYGTYLLKYHYNIIHEDSPDRRGIDVCLIYRRNIAELLCYKYWIPPGNKQQDFKTRSVLYAKLVSNSDTIHFIVNHWPSRRGGVLAGEDLRLKIASMIRVKIDSIMGINPNGAKIIVLGDFNCAPDDQVINYLINSSDSARSLINLSTSLNNSGYGTYRYSGVWEMIDQFIVSKRLLSGDEGFFTRPDLLKIFKSDFLLIKDPKYPGLSPFSTYRGYSYHGGFSDHLPVLLDLYFR